MQERKIKHHILVLQTAHIIYDPATVAWHGYVVLQEDHSNRVDLLQLHAHYTDQYTVVISCLLY